MDLAVRLQPYPIQLRAKKVRGLDEKADVLVRLYLSFFSLSKVTLDFRSDLS